jgi:hypothetical protein
MPAVTVSASLEKWAFFLLHPLYIKVGSCLSPVVFIILPYFSYEIFTAFFFLSYADIEADAVRDVTAILSVSAFRNCFPFSCALFSGAVSG